jgi:hypothetical protein
MTTTTIRKKLIDYIADADEKKVKGLYMLVSDEMGQDSKNFKLSSGEIAFIKREREKHLSGKTKSYSRKEAMTIIKAKKAI